MTTRSAKSPWIVVNRETGQRLGMYKNFQTVEEAGKFLIRLGPILQKMYRAYFERDDPKLGRMINEGLIRNDLEGILLPRLRVDEYVPSDPNTDNVVIAFLIKSVPEAVLPFKRFVEKCNGVLDVDYGDSDTLPNTSVIYVELEREGLDLGHIYEMVEFVGIVSNLKPEDFTLTFPNTNKKFPFELKIIGEYFASRNIKKNLMAQKKAEEEARKAIEKQLQAQAKDNPGKPTPSQGKRGEADLAHAGDSDTKPGDNADTEVGKDMGEEMAKAANESLIQRIANTILETDRWATR